MTEADCLSRMVPPGANRGSRFGGGVIQVLVTHSCTLACANCTQGSNLAAPRWEMTPRQFRLACQSLKTYHGVVGMFGGCPSVHTQFAELCEVMREEIPFERRGLWCNDPTTVEKARIMRETFNPCVSNLNVHMNRRAYAKFLEGWPELARFPGNFFGLEQDSRHSPVFGSMKDLGVPEEERWELISRCDVNQLWSSLIGVFRGELRAWFCEIAASQAIHHQHEPDYPDTGRELWYDPWDEAERLGIEQKGGGIKLPWWTLKMQSFADQVGFHCHDCIVPLRGHGALAMDDDGVDQITARHQAIYKPKRKGHAVELVTTREQLGEPLQRATNYLQNARV